jgi:hypothetical protein
MKPVDWSIGSFRIVELDMTNERRVTFNPRLTEAELARFFAAVA